MSIIGVLTSDVLASPIFICLVYEPQRFLPHISDGEVKDLRSLLDEIPPKQGQKHPGGVLCF